MKSSISKLLEEHFDTAFAAPDGITKLRDLILSLALQGKLVQQDPNDSPASDLLKEIETEKKYLVKAGKIKKTKPLPKVQESDILYALPDSWIWTRLGNIGNIFNGNSINAREKQSKYAGVSGLPYIATKDVSYGFEPLDYKNGINIPETEPKFKVAHKGAVLICSEGGSAGKKCGITEEDICFGNKLYANESFGGITPRFILYLYLSPVFRDRFSAAMTGIIGGVSMAKFLALPIPLPPLKEQQRIVAKVDQLMARCDALERLRKERTEKRLAVHAAAIKKLLDTPDNSAWDFIQQHFGEVYSVKENIEELRKAIIQLAIMGVLVKPTIQNSGMIGKSNNTNKNKPFSIPNHWKWTSLSSVSNKDRGITYGIVKMGDEPKAGGVFALRCSDVKFRTLDLSSVRTVTEEISQQYSRTVLKGGELLLNIRGTLGGCAVVTHKIAGYNIAREIALIPLSDEADAFYVLNVISSPYFTEATTQNLRGIAYKGLNLGILANFQIPLPPKDEQLLIVEKVNQLMGLCDSLEQQIDITTDKQTELLNAVMAQV
jgi:type I restriction enzyme S subunit